MNCLWDAMVEMEINLESPMFWWCSSLELLWALPLKSQAAVIGILKIQRFSAIVVEVFRTVFRKKVWSAEVTSYKVGLNQTKKSLGGVSGSRVSGWISPINSRVISSKAVGMFGESLSGWGSSRSDLGTVRCRKTNWVTELLAPLISWREEVKRLLSRSMLNLLNKMGHSVLSLCVPRI